MRTWKLVAGSLALGIPLAMPLPAQTGGHAHGQAQTGAGAHTHGQSQEQKVKDPVCGMDVLPSKSEKAVYKKKTYYFCSAAEKTQFEKDPAKFLKKTK